MWFLLSNFKPIHYLLFAGFLSAVALGFYGRKLLLESMYKRQVHKDKVQFSDCVKRAKLPEDYQACYALAEKATKKKGGSK